jgi:hypothetical protein
MRVGAAAAALAASLTLAPAADAAGWAPLRQGEDFSWQGAIGVGRHLEIKGVNGSIEAGPAGSDQVEVTATKRGRRSDPDRVRIEVIEHERGVTLCVVYPSPPGSPPNRCAPGEAGRTSTRNNDVYVDFRVRLPDGVGLVARTVNGNVRAEALGGDVHAHTVNGNVEISTSERAQAATVNGSIHATLGRTTEAGSLEFETVNGRITVELPSSAGADVQAETVNGDISTDFPVTVRGRFSARKVSGTIGKGGPDLLLRTVNGNIRIRSLVSGDS